LKGADQIFSRFLGARQGFHDLLIPFRLAQWEYLTGRRKQAIARLGQMTGGAQPALAALAAAQLSVWMIETGDAARAREYALRAAPAGALAGVCRFLTEPPATASEWEARAERAFPEPAQAAARQFALAVALLYSKQFPEASAVLRKRYDQTPPASPDPVEVPLAWALLESGQVKPAEDLLATNAIPDPLRDSLFLSLSFPRVFYLRGVVLEKQGRREEARANYELFLRFSGDLPGIFGEEQRAREALRRR
jgi:tetratricopeptide (TPR) repeat protein